MTAFRPNNDHARVRYVLLQKYSPRVEKKLGKSGPQKTSYLLAGDGETMKKKRGGRRKNEPGKEVVNERAENEEEGNIKKKEKHKNETCRD